MKKKEIEKVSKEGIGNIADGKRERGKEGRKRGKKAIARLVISIDVTGTLRDNFK